MTSYDENLEVNPFLVQLKDRYTELWQMVLKRKLTIVVPQRSAVPQAITAEVLGRHILDCDSQNNTFRNLQQEEVICSDGKFSLMSAAPNHMCSNVLFEETFYTSEGQNCHIVCIDRPLTPTDASERKILLPPMLSKLAVEAARSALATIQLTTDNSTIYPTSSSPSTTPSDSCAETRFAHTVLFGSSADKDTSTRLQGHMRRQCRQFIAKLNAAISDNSTRHTGALSAESIRNLTSAEFASLLRHVHRQKQHRGVAGCYDPSMLTLATEIYFFNQVGDAILYALRGCLWEKEAETNRYIRVACTVTPQDLGVNLVLCDRLMAARKELSLINNTAIPHSRLICLRKCIVALSVGTTNNGTSTFQVSSDDLIPAIIFVILKSPMITDWCSSIALMSEFHFSRASGDELGYCLASFEAAVQFIRNGSPLCQSSVGGESCEDESTVEDDVGLFEKTSVEADRFCQMRSLQEYLIELIRADDDVTLTEFFEQQKAVEEVERQRRSSTSKSKCHPLCECNRCAPCKSKSADENGNPSAEKSTIVKRSSMIDVNAVLNHKGQTALHLACRLGKTTAVNALAKFGARLDEEDEEGYSPLHLVCKEGHQSVTLLLLHLGADCNQRDRVGDTPLHIATAYYHLDCLKALLYFDRHVKNLAPKIDCVNDVGDTPLHIAVRMHYVVLGDFAAEAVRILMESGADAKVKNRQKQSPFDLCNSFVIKQCLLKADPALDFITETDVECGVTAALAVDVLSLESALDSSLVLSDSDERSSTLSPYSGVATPTSLSALSQFKRSGSQQQPTATPLITKLMRSINDDDLPMVEHCCSRLTNEAESLCRDSCHPLCQCDRCCPITTEKSGSQNNLDWDDATSNPSLRAQQPFSMTVNDCTVGGFAPLHLACRLGRLEITKFLVEHADADVTLPTADGAGNTPLHVAAKEGELRLVSYLLSRHGVELDCKNTTGETPLHLAAAIVEFGIVKLLLNTFSPTAKPLSSYVNECNRSGESALHYAAKCDRRSMLSDGRSATDETVQLLLDAGADPLLGDATRLTPIDVAWHASTRNILQRSLDVRLTR